MPTSGISQLSYANHSPKICNEQQTYRAAPSFETPLHWTKSPNSVPIRQECERVQIPNARTEHRKHQHRAEHQPTKHFPNLKSAFPPSLVLGRGVSTLDKHSIIIASGSCSGLRTASKLNRTESNRVKGERLVGYVSDIQPPHHTHA